MALDLSGHHFMDGKDLWTAYNIFVENGSDQFLLAPERKESITHDWGDSNGIDVDASRPQFKERTIPLDFAIIVESQEQFWQKYNGFIKDISQPGLRRWEVAVHPDFSHYVLYQKMDGMNVFTKWKNTGLIAAKFQLTLLEPEPNMGEGDIYLVDDEDRYIIT